MKFSKATLIPVLLLILSLCLFPATAEAQRGGGNSGFDLDIPLSGTFNDALGGVGDLTGTLNLTQVSVVDGALMAVGTLTGTLTDSAGDVVGTIVRNVSIPLSATQASCEILNLELGAISLDLLGLTVDLSQVNLDIAAVPGAGNLLGNLLCAVANLLNGGGPLQGIANLLNNILGLL